MPLYDILNEFQKGSSHMAAVVKVREKEKKLLSNGMAGDKISTKGDSQLRVPLLDKHGGEPNTVVVNIDKSQQNGCVKYNSMHVLDETEDGEVIGIITLEDVFEELLQVIFVVSIFFFLRKSLFISSNFPFPLHVYEYRRRLLMRQMCM